MGNVVGRVAVVVVLVVLDVARCVVVAVLAVVFMFVPMRQAVNRHAVRTNTRAIMIVFFIVVPPVLLMQS